MNHIFIGQYLKERFICILNLSFTFGLISYLNLWIARIDTMWPDGGTVLNVNRKLIYNVESDIYTWNDYNEIIMKNALKNKLNEKYGYSTTFIFDLTVVINKQSVQSHQK